MVSYNGSKILDPFQICLSNLPLRVQYQWRSYRIFEESQGSCGNRGCGWHVPYWQELPSEQNDPQQAQWLRSGTNHQSLHKSKLLHPQGLWIWKKPLPGFSTDGEPINVLVVDSEGLGALDEDSNHDVRIFSLAILLSSYFIYNSVGSIDENAVQNLSLVINLTKHIHVKSGAASDDIDPEEYSRYFPSFMWVVRDFTLQLID